MPEEAPRGSCSPRKSWGTLQLHSRQTKHEGVEYRYDPKSARDYIQQESLMQEPAVDLEALSRLPRPTVGEITALLDSAAEGGEGARSDLLEVIYGELYRIARGQRHRAAGRGVTLDTTGLVNEAYLKLFHRSPQKARDREHFFAIAAGAMRHILVDYARSRQRRKRGGDWNKVELSSRYSDANQNIQEILEVQDALSDLAAIDPRLRQIVECRYFAGYTEQETADTLGLSLRTVQRSWKAARVWLGGRLASPSQQQDSS